METRREGNTLYVSFPVAFNLRMDGPLREKVEKAAQENSRSLNAEICYRLRQSFDGWKLDRARP